MRNLKDHSLCSIVPDNRITVFYRRCTFMLFIQTLFSSPITFFMVCLIVIFSVCCHEFCHAWIAVREGDYTLEDHLTLNPLKQMGVMSLFMLALVGIAWGSVPVHHELLRSRRSLLKIALAGPVLNLFFLLLAWGLILMIPLLVKDSSQTVVMVLFSFIYLFGIYNFVLLVFNLIPAPGLDGWIIASELFPKLKTLSSEWIKGAMLLLMLLAFVGVRFLYGAGKLLMNSAILTAKAIMGGN